VSGFAVTSSRADGPLVLRGFVAKTAEWYDIGAGVQELLEPGRFRRTLQNGPDVILNLLHGRAGTGLPLARSTAGTLSMREIVSGPQTGLYIEATLDEDDPDSQLLARKLARGDLDGQASFAFTVSKNGQSWSDDFRHRRLSEVNLHRGDVSVVDHGANPRTSVGMAGPAPRSVVRTQDMLSLIDHTTTARRRYQLLVRRLEGK
jgi:HK97 family phage prohead protease